MNEERKRETERITTLTFLSVVLSLPTLLMSMNHWNKTFSVIWIFNLCAYYALFALIYNLVES